MHSSRKWWKAAERDKVRVGGDMQRSILEDLTKKISWQMERTFPDKCRARQKAKPFPDKFLPMNNTAGALVRADKPYSVRYCWRVRGLETAFKMHCLYVLAM